MSAMGWANLETPDLTGRTAVVTGASDGVGRATATQLALWGARVVLPVRNRTKAEAVARMISQRTGRDDAAALTTLDLADLASVRSGAAEVLEATGSRIDLLINVAGMVTPSRRETIDGFEMMLGTNFLGPFLFTELLRDSVSERIVNVASDSHRAGRMDLTDPHFRRSRWSLGAAYGRSKLAMMLWSVELNRQLADTGVEVQMAHPGWVLTNLQRATGRPRLDDAITAVCSLVAMSPDCGAFSVLFAATQQLPPLSYIGPDGPWALRGRPTFLLPSAAARDGGLAKDVVAWATDQCSSAGLDIGRSGSALHSDNDPS